MRPSIRFQAASTAAVLSTLLPTCVRPTSVLASVLRAVLPAVLLGLVATSAGAAGRKEPPSRVEQQAVAGIHDAMRSGGSCELAVSRLNDGLKRKYPSVYLMAGTMYEQGVCLKPDWDRAARMYQAANAAGEPKGLLKLVAGLAQGGRDRAAALYWAMESATQGLPDECTAGRELRDDPDAYVAQLRGWPAGQLDACVYVAGVVAAIGGDVEYPAIGTAYAVYGSYRMDFRPAAAAVEWTELELRLSDMGVASGDDVRDRDSRRVRDSLRRELQEASERALRRFTAPAGLPAGWRLQQIYTFNIMG